MKPDADLDAYLASQLGEAALPDHGFTSAINARMKRHRRHRRLALACTIAAAIVLAPVTAYRLPTPIFSLHIITPESVVATLVLLAACSFVWIGTESRPPNRVVRRALLVESPPDPPAGDP